MHRNKIGDHWGFGLFPTALLRVTLLVDSKHTGVEIKKMRLIVILIIASICIPAIDNFKVDTPDGPVRFIDFLDGDSSTSMGVFKNNDIYKAGWAGQGLVINPDRDLVAVYVGYAKDDKFSELSVLPRLRQVLNGVYAEK